MSKLKLNKKGNLKKNYIAVGIVADVIRYGVPITYIAFMFDLFKFNDPKFSLTGWAFVVIIVGVFFFKGKFKEMLEDWDNNLGNLSSHIKVSTGWFVVFVIMFGIMVATRTALWLAFIFGVSNTISIYPYSIKYKRKAEYDTMVAYMKTRENEKKAKKLELEAQEIVTLRNQKKTSKKKS